MPKSNARAVTGGKTAQATLAAALSWREFFERLGDGTLQDGANSAPEIERRTAA